MRVEQIRERSREDVRNAILLRGYKDVAGSKINLDEDRVHEIGEALLKHFGSIQLTAIELKMEERHLLYHIANNYELSVYHELAVEFTKGLLDKNVLEFLQSDDDEQRLAMTKLMFSKYYAGRDKGGFNVGEFGTTGYKDKNAEAIVNQTKGAMESKNVVVNILMVDEKPHSTGAGAPLDEADFGKMEIKQDSSEDFIDVDYEDVDLGETNLEDI